MAKATALTVTPTRRRCGKCGRTRPVKYFYRHSRDGFQSWCKDCRAASELERLYGISVEEYNRLFDQQSGQCAICDETPKYHLYVDHDHETGKVRGLLCRACNFAVGLYERRKGRIESYLGKS